MRRTVPGSRRLRRAGAGPRVAAGFVAIALLLAACGTDTGLTQGESRAIDGAVPTMADDPDPSGSPDGDDPDGETPGGTDAPPPATAAPDTTDPAPGTFVPDPIVWDTYTDAVDVGVLDVPIDYADPDGGTIELFLARHRAKVPDQRIGSLLVNPGGPGFPGTDYAIFAAQIYEDDLLDRFDIIGWDPRGTGESFPAIDCIDDYDRYFASLDSADDPAAFSEELAIEFAGECVRRNEAIVHHVGTNNSARDMDTIRRALDEATISYLGFSYGSELGAVWATLFPDTVRAAVLDGAADPTADRLEGSLQQMAGFEASVARFLERCSQNPDCAFHRDGETEDAYDALLARLADEPIPSDPGRPMVGRSIAITATLVAMYNEAYWPQLERALDAADRGDGSRLLALFDTYYQRQPDGTWGNELEAFQVISCADEPERPDADQVRAEIERYREVAPRLFPADDDTPGFFCTFFPPSVDPRVEVTGAGAGPILVVGNTGDPTTPLASTRTMAASLEQGVLVVVDSNNHGGYFTSECARSIIGEYLVDLVVPLDGTQCG